MDLSTSYLGLELRNPLVASASPLSMEVENFKRLEDAGAAAVVMHSLFEEQITHESKELDHYLSYGIESNAEALTYFPDLEEYDVGPEEYLNNIRAAKREVDIPIIGSLNGVSAGGWTEYAKHIEEAGADALELNIYFIPTSLDLAAAEIEDMYAEVAKQVIETTSLPVAVKLSPYFTAMPSMAQRLAGTGAKGLVLFNRFFQPDFDIEELEVVPRLVLSDSNELRLPLRWVAILYGQVSVDFAITSGVHSHEDVLKSMMAGANVAMMASEILQNGIERLTDILTDMTLWMETHEYESVRQMQGSLSRRHASEGAAFERANYMKTLQSWRPDPMSKFV